jgi:hypothetical protein
LPLILQPFIKDPQHPVLLLILQLHKLQEFYLSEKIMAWELDVLEELTVEFFELRAECDRQFPACFTSIKPKE